MANALTDLLNFSQTSFVPREVWESMGLVPPNKVHIGILENTRWGLRCYADGDRRRNPARKYGAKKLDGSRRSARDYELEVMVPHDQIGAQWLADNDPEFELVRVYPGDPDLGNDDCHVFSPIAFDPCELYSDMDASYDNKFAGDDEDLTGDPYGLDDPNRIQSPKIFLDIHPYTRQLFLLQHSLPGQMLDGEIKLVQVLADQIREVPGVEAEVRPILVQMALTTVTIDGRTIFQNEDQAQSRSTLQILYLVVSALVGDSLKRKKIWQAKQAERMRNTSPAKPKKAKKDGKQKKDEKKTPKKKASSKPKKKAKKGPNVWGILVSFLKRCLEHVRPLVRKHEATAIRTAQFAELDLWAAGRSEGEREQFLCRWRIQIIRLACELLDADRADEHASRGFVVALSYVGTPKGRRSADAFDARDVIRFLEGHPDDHATKLLAEFRPAWNDIVGTELDDEEIEADEPPAVAIPPRVVSQSPAEALKALMAEMMRK